jgi:hypothetical protein
MRRHLAVLRFSRAARERRLQREKAVTLMAALYRGHLARRWLRMYKAVTSLAAKARGFLARRHYARLRSRAKILAQWRGKRDRRMYIRARAAVVTVQGFARIVIAKRRRWDLYHVVRMQVGEAEVLVG